jgi:hypothetical protein
MRRSALAALSQAILTASAQSADIPSLAFHPQILEAKFCLEKGGQISVHVPFKQEFKNDGNVPVILLRSAPYLRFTLLPLEKRSGEAWRSVKYPARQIMDASRTVLPTPDPKLFVVLQLGETYNGAQDELSIHLARDRTAR